MLPSFVIDRVLVVYIPPPVLELEEKGRWSFFVCAPRLPWQRVAYSVLGTYTLDNVYIHIYIYWNLFFESHLSLLLTDSPADRARCRAARKTTSRSRGR